MERGCWRPEVYPGKAGGGHAALRVSLVKARALCPTAVGGADGWGSPLELSQQGGNAASHLWGASWVPGAGLPALIA